MEQNSTPSADYIRSLEYQRTQALVQRDVEFAKRLHSPQYQLITPSGKTYSLISYLEDIASGELRYEAWEIGPCEVRLSPSMAVIRYKAKLLFTSGAVHCWHTDTYELQGDAWLAVWSQATAIKHAGQSA
ncbi:nuclear transport factor 2 family protein [Chitinivorax sp. B]|uniref:nuclear transport factor 2 family protein n=1 Tax=Chitinivorax sp. B TaxID=2502235 RepID=UPI0010FA567D|nr:nuclear transport factor 2 family protein [Chitinivorax sp. B]